MIKVEKIDVWGFEHAIRGMRNPMNSWDKSDSEKKYWCSSLGPNESPHYCNSCGYDMCHPYEGDPVFVIGKNDLDLMRRLYKAGPEHRKYLRQIFVSMDITAPLYWWKEFDTYKVGTVANSCSTMHKIHAKEFAVEDFSTEHLETLARFDEDGEMHKPYMVLKVVIDCLNACRNSYLQTKNKTDWWQMIQLLPSSYNQMRTVDMSYESLFNMWTYRQNHKLDEWRDFCLWVEQLPYHEIIIGKVGE